MSPALLATLSWLPLGAPRTTTELFDDPACWVSRSALRARLAKLLKLGLVTRARGRGRHADSWSMTTKGRLVFYGAQVARKAAA